MFGFLRPLPCFLSLSILLTQTYVRGRINLLVMDTSTWVNTKAGMPYQTRLFIQSPKSVRPSNSLARRLRQFTHPSSRVDDRDQLQVPSLGLSTAIT